MKSCNLAPFSKPTALFGWFCVGPLVFLLATAATRPDAADHQKPKTFIPKIAEIAGIKVGYSSMEKLEGLLGQGKAEVGGHPNGARLWRVKGTSWVIYADAFDYSESGLVVNSFDITADPKSRRDVPYARLSRNDLAWAGSIAPGMDENELLQFLRQNSWTAAKVAGGWLVGAPGQSPLRGGDFFNDWGARFTIEGKSVVGISLYARHNDNHVARQTGPGQKKDTPH